jgi:GT2 family glycosyltransferase
MSQMNNLAILLTCHNREALTLACLNALFQCQLPIVCSIEVFLVDDGSTDGTGEAVRNYYPQVKVIKGDGYLYWNGGMRVAFSAAMKKGFDYYLWLNDDTLLYPNAIQTLVGRAMDLRTQYSKSVIVVGATEDKKEGRLTYGGVVRASRWKRTSFTLIKPGDVPVECETMNGNCVLIPSEIAQAVGGMEPKFAHAMGDLDYGLRSRAAGFAIWVLPGLVGTCAKNPVTGSFNDRSLPLSLRLQKMLEPKGLPLKSWFVFTRRHAGLLWPIYWLWPYVKVTLKGLIKK